MALGTVKELIPEIDKALQYLKTCEDFTSYDATESFKVLRKASEGSSCRAVGMHLIGEGFGQLFVKMWNSLCGYLDREKWRQRGYINLLLMTACYFNYTDNCSELGVELSKNGCIRLLLAGLDKIKMYFNQESDFEVAHKFGSIFGILHNSIRLCSGNREIYRNAGAVDILQEYLKQSSVLVSTRALMILAYIVKESESDILAKSKVGVATLVQLLQEAVKSSDHRAKIHHNMNSYGFSAFELLDCLNHLAVNDDNKRAIDQQGGIPVIIRMLEDDFSEEDQCVAAEALWNLAFINSVRQSQGLQVALTGK